MKKLTTALLGVLISLNTSASEVAHFKAKPVTDLSSALCNLKQYDQQLRRLTSKTKMTFSDSAQVHELTYTLEVALQKVKDEVSRAAAELEKSHKASEVANFSLVKQASAEYLKVTKVLTTPLNCK
ncbi:DUF6746 family protein [Catenovulum maritimum]|uniref:Uncharacterized protein n=1 Tax=Catenovulum maritimum TaxID=1513271 RepID=A0A0J8GMA7_9ALTE|nr:DUF6746 family protein [Catenovulum maritimum]KMT63967.1 hypothetical protein XM47_16790 [Catenovulum maritimum]